MKFSTKARYSLRVMLELALHSGRGPLSVKEIGKKQGISWRYLERIMSMLVSSGLVISERGSGGGFKLTREPKDINLLEIIEAVEGKLTPVFCVTEPRRCRNSNVCVIRDIWLKLKQSMVSTLESITLQDLVCMYNERISKVRIFHI